MPKKRFRDWNLQGQPMHHLIPIQKFVRYNLDFPPDYISGKNIYKQYPFKCTPSGRRSSIVGAKEMTDYKYSLTSQEYKDIIDSYGQHLHMYLLGGKTYEFPVWRLGDIRLVRTKKKTVSGYLSYKYGKPVAWYFPDKDGYKLNNIWNKKFKFARIWHVTFPRIYSKLNENMDMFYNLSTR